MFTNFHALINYSYECISFQYIVDVNTLSYHLAFEFVGQHYFGPHLQIQKGHMVLLQDIYVKVVASMKQQCQ